MIGCIRYISSTGTVPYDNLALEEYLLDTVRPGECILYLWQNRRTVVIGRNQNAWKECRTGQLEADGGFLARRLSGGGAVFHDLGNLNFTFLIHEGDYDVDRQLDVIVGALKKLGVGAGKNGRNDITAEGRKISGNAFYRAGGRCYHHGTVMVGVDTENLSKYLNVSAEKLKSKGVASVRSRVGNLTDFQPGITVELVRGKLIETFGEVYGLTPAEIPAGELESRRLEKLAKRYASWEWNFGKKLAFETELSHRFDWGDIQIQLKLENGKVREALVYSDAMDFDFATRVPRVLEGTVFSAGAMADAVETAAARDESARRMRSDVAAFLRAQNL